MSFSKNIMTSYWVCSWSDHICHKVHFRLSIENSNLFCLVCLILQLLTIYNKYTVGNWRIHLHIGLQTKTFLRSWDEALQQSELNQLKLFYETQFLSLIALKILESFVYQGPFHIYLHLFYCSHQFLRL